MKEGVLRCCAQCGLHCCAEAGCLSRSCIVWKRLKKDTSNVNRKPYPSFQMVSFSVTVSDISPRFQLQVTPVLTLNMSAVVQDSLYKHPLLSSVILN